MNTIFNRLASRRGESLIESMVAILVFTFASIIMLTMITSAVNINQVAKDADQAYFEQMTAIEAKGGTPSSGNNEFSFSNGRLKETVSVAVYGAADGLHAYYGN